MIQFIKNHVATCDACLSDPDIEDEIEKITELILPESKIPKAVRLQQEKENAELEEEDEEIDEEDESEDDDEDEDEDEEYLDDDDDIDEDGIDDID